jgi:hypothetical protein
MGKAQYIEVVGLGIATGVVGAFGALLPARIELGSAVLGAAALLLGQGLVRDLLRLRAARAARVEAPGPSRTVTCVCAESTIGVVAILVGLCLVFAASPLVLRVPRFGWCAGVGAVLFFGFLVRNVVFDWRELRLRFESDHTAPVVWKK